MPYICTHVELVQLNNREGKRFMATNIRYITKSNAIWAEQLTLNYRVMYPRSQITHFNTINHIHLTDIKLIVNELDIPYLSVLDSPYTFHIVLLYNRRFLLKRKQHCQYKQLYGLVVL